MLRVLVFVVFAIFSHVSFAGVKSLGAPVEVTSSNGQKYIKVDVRCDNSDLRPSIRKRVRATRWCSTLDAQLCAVGKMAVAIKVCKSGYLSKVRKRLEKDDNLSSSIEDSIVKKSELDIEREKIEIEKQRIELEKQRVVLQQLQAELQKLEFELQRDKAN